MQINTVKHRNDWQVLKITEHVLLCFIVTALYYLMAQKILISTEGVHNLQALEIHIYK